MLDHPEMPVKDAMELSSRMMSGYKLKFFCHSLLIFVIGLLFGIFTLWISMIWYIPFIYAFFAGFYNKVKAEKCPEPIEEEPIADAEIQ